MMDVQTFRVPDAAWRIVFSVEGLKVLDNHRQLQKGSSEVVGQLFASDLTGDDVIIDMVTVLPPKQASSHGVIFSPESAKLKREQLFDSGLHFVGFWHSHPQKRPSPSGTDLQFAAEHARAALHNLTGILFTIVGTNSFPDGLFVGVHDGSRLHNARFEY